MLQINSKQIWFTCCLMICIIFPITPSLALLSGIIFALTISNPFIKYNSRATTLLLQFSIVCLGFNIDLDHALVAGQKGFFITICFIISTIAVGFLISKILKIDKTISFLISNGTAICGGSAIAMLAPVVKANAQQISVALGTVFILNAIALFIFPSLGHLANLTAEQFGTWCAIAIHDTSSVVGAASKWPDPIALKIATTIKLERALWIIPIALVTAYFQKNSEAKIKIPYFIFLFILAIIINSYLPISYSFNGYTPYEYIYMLGKKGLVITLFLIGSGLSLQTIKTVGWKPILQGVILWILISTSSLFIIKNFSSFIV